MKCKLKTTLIAAFFLLTLPNIAVSSLAVGYSQKINEVYIFGFLDSTNTRTLLGYLNNRSDWEVIFYDLNETSGQNRTLELIKVFKVVNINFMPPDVCPSCEHEHSMFFSLDFWINSTSPLVGFFHNGKLSSITIGLSSHEILDQALAADSEQVKVFTYDNTYTIDDESIRTRLEELFVGQENNMTGINALSLLAPLVFLALADSVNPCTFAVFTAMLLIALHSLSKTKAITVGFTFIIAVFTGYLVLGLGLYRIFSIVPIIPYFNQFLAIIGLVIGVFTVAQSLKPKFISPIPNSFRRLLESRIIRSYVSPLASFFLGILATITLLPCSSGPYLIGLSLLSNLREFAQIFLLLVMYNLIFVSPLFLILVALLASESLSHKIKVFRSRKLKIMELVSGMLLITVCLYLLFRV